MKHIAILRFSAITEIAIAAPLIRAYALANPDIRFTVVSIPFLRAFFDGIPNLGYLPLNVSEAQEEKYSLSFLWHVIRTVFGTRPTGIADLSNTSLSRAVCSIPKMHGVEIHSVKDPTRFSMKNEHIQKRYEDVLTSFGIDSLHFAERPFEPHVKMKYTFHRIGIAPFAKYEGKSWPYKNMESVVASLCSDPNNKIYLFGDKNREAQILQGWEFLYPNCESIAGKYILKEELDLIRSLDLMVTMDSANMHFASFVQTPVISIWGATHPSLGYYGCGQDPDYAIGVKMGCRPCSLFGNGQCSRHDYACLTRITPDMVIDKINKFFAQV